METFSHAELAYLQSERRLARLATADADGQPHVTPVGMWSYNAALNTIDVSGRNFAATRKYRNVRTNPKAALVVDDLASVDPWRPRAVLVEGPAEAVAPDDGNAALIRIALARIISWGLDTQ
ncbi:MAG: PPOX class F420-dependent oxidoreductase [Actinomycetota bacterium]|nr:PPOX class F420-dependent oxidoreductase [Actinomycetota bacterium]